MYLSSPITGYRLLDEAELLRQPAEIATSVTRSVENQLLFPRYKFLVIDGILVVAPLGDHWVVAAWVLRSVEDIILFDHCFGFLNQFVNQTKPRITGAGNLAKDLKVNQWESIMFGETPESMKEPILRMLDLMVKDLVLKPE